DAGVSSVTKTGTIGQAETADAGKDRRRSRHNAGRRSIIDDDNFGSGGSVALQAGKAEMEQVGPGMTGDHDGEGRPHTRLPLVAQRGGGGGPPWRGPHGPFPPPAGLVDGTGWPRRHPHASRPTLAAARPRVAPPLPGHPSARAASA